MNGQDFTVWLPPLVAVAALVYLAVFLVRERLRSLSRRSSRPRNPDPDPRSWQLGAHLDKRVANHFRDDEQNKQPPTKDALLEFSVELTKLLRRHEVGGPIGHEANMAVFMVGCMLAYDSTSIELFKEIWGSRSSPEAQPDGDEG